MKLHQIDGYIQSIYLVEYRYGLLLLDGCCRADIPILLDFIREHLKRPVRDLKLVVVTHMHPDHAGAAHRLRKLTGCCIAAANVPGQWYQGIDGMLMHWTDLLLASWVAKRMRKPRCNLWYNAKLKPDYLLDDQELVPGFPEWRALSTQGHTDRDLSLYHQDSGKVYVADLMVKVKGRYIPPFPVFYPKRYRQSINKIVALTPSTLLLAHGGEICPSQEDFQHLLDKAPTTPTTHWRSVKTKFKRAFSAT
ncbi:Zn-dependent hydrolase [Photobacterium gaetbulicola]|uniref:Zn-dependent hydrolase n=1 Tax=Photobacterium gaetbulicola TaxID=1295392 RepID=A0A0B9H7H2_9GAMM|nr:MBL fold metallo-hydrolase [Photobacterium gaetbulicola]KHT64852.1 Zn-dependent hydrolase [Photobacterium gaetbulicola]